MKIKLASCPKKMIRDGEDCCHAEFVFGLFDLKERRLILPTPEWLCAIGL
jgi:hypothetical protein